LFFLEKRTAKRSRKVPAKGVEKYLQKVINTRDGVVGETSWFPYV
jgi:hypothetical protein